ncbi:TonB-dependent receptor, partial [Xanthomonas vasicola]
MSPSRAAVLPKRLALQTTTLASALMFVLAATAVPAAAQQRSDGADDDTQTLDKVSVTGTHLRRVDAETASPVVVIDRQRIEDSGQSTLGQLLQRLPMMAGFQT